jgi:hypothetical protein
MLKNSFFGLTMALASIENKELTGAEEGKTGCFSTFSASC